MLAMLLGVLFSLSLFIFLLVPFFPLRGLLPESSILSRTFITMGWRVA